MIYSLMNKNICVFDFESSDTGIHPFLISNAQNSDYAPLAIDIDDGIVNKADFEKWLSHRRIPASRQFLAQTLDELSFATHDIITTNFLAEQCYYLSLSDQYWIKPKDSNLSWDKINFFTNSFSDDMGKALLDKEFVDNPDLVSPCNSSEGNLKKKWKIIDNKRCLIKSGTGYSAQETYNEKIATRICELLGISNYTPYTLELTKNGTVSICECFINENTELITANDVLNHFLPNPRVSRYEHYTRCCNRLGVNCTDSLDDIIVLDYLIGNTDRHLRNFGLIRDVNTLDIIGSAPIFDSGTSLCYNIPETFIDYNADIESKPFLKYHSEQIKLVSQPNKYDFSSLFTLKNDCADILAEYNRISAPRIQILSAFIDNRVEMIKNEFCKGYTNGIDELDLTQNNKREL